MAKFRLSFRIVISLSSGMGVRLNARCLLVIAVRAITAKSEIWKDRWKERKYQRKKKHERRILGVSFLNDGKYIAQKITTQHLLLHTE